MARSLGGEVLTIASDDIVSPLMRLARQRNVTQIVIGKPIQSWLREFLSGGSLVDKLVHASGDIDIYVVSGDKTESSEKPLLSYPTLHSVPNPSVIAVAVVAPLTA